MNNTKNNKRLYISILLSILMAVVLAFFLSFLESMASGTIVYQSPFSLTVTQYADLLKAGNYTNSLIIMIILFGAIFESLFLAGKQIGDFVYKYRYWIAVVFVVVCVIFKLNGSSIGYWEHFLNLDEDTGVLVGQSRAIRSDEWAVFTPMALSQYFNGFSYTSELWRGSLTDMFTVYGQPVLSWIQIFRPFQIGYLFMPADYGLSFYWCSRFAVLMLVSFEFGMLLTRGNKPLSSAYMLMITFAPVIQWWYSINALVETLIFGQIIVLCVNAFLETRSYKKRWLWAVVFAWAACGFILVIYPSWQVPFFYAFAAICLWLIVTKWKAARFTRRDLLPAAAAILIIAGVMLYFLLKSYDAIYAMLNTAYPGKRIVTDEARPASLLRYPGDLFISFSDYLMPGNQPENASFFSLFPIGAILAGWLLIRKKKKDPLMTVMLVLALLLGLYVAFGCPEWLGKITLLNYSQPARTEIVFDFVNLLLLFRALSYKDSFRPVPGLITAAAAGIGVVWVSKAVLYADYLPTKMMLIDMAVVVVFAAASLLYWNREWIRKLFFVMILIICIMCGAFVNPIRTGTGPIADSPLTVKVSELSADTDGRWIVEGVDWASAGNLFAASGAKVVNTTNVYPNVDLWKIVDPDGSQEEYYNRYAHIRVNLSTTEPTGFQLAFVDSLILTLNVDDLQKLGVEYIYSTNELEKFDSGKISFDKVWSDEGGAIYRVDYL